MNCKYCNINIYSKNRTKCCTKCLVFYQVDGNYVSSTFIYHNNWRIHFNHTSNVGQLQTLIKQPNANLDYYYKYAFQIQPNLMNLSLQDIYEKINSLIPFI